MNSKYADELSKRDALLGGVAEAARRLLVAADFNTAIDGALEAIAAAANIDRVYILKNRLDAETGETVAECPYEWTAPGTVRVSQIPDRFPMALGIFGSATQELKAGRPIQVLARELPAPARALQAIDNALSLLAVPIATGNGHWWGVIGFDDCTTERAWSQAEIAVLETAAACVGCAIERDLARKERETATQASAAELEAHNRQLRARDGLLNCVNAAAQCLVANDDLSAALPAMLEILGKGTSQCRAYILQLARDHRTEEPVFELAFEWDAPGIPRKLATGGRFPVPVDAFPESLTAPLRAGRATQFFARALDGISPEERLLGQARSLVGVPIKVASEWWGLLGLDNCIEERTWSEAEITVLEAAATAVGNAVERDRSRQAREAAEREILLARATELAKINEAISRTLTTLVTCPELDQFLGHLLAEMARQLGAGNVHLFLYDRATDTLTQRVAVCDGQIYLGTAPKDPEMFRRPIPVSLTSGWKAIIHATRPLTYDEHCLYDEEVWWPESLAWHQSQGHKLVACIPMKAGEQPIGFISFCFYNRTKLTDEQLEFMQALANQAIVAVQLTRLAEKSQSAALTNERNRLAREIHDTLAQAFTGVSLQLEAVRGLAGKTTPAEALDRAQTYIRRARNLARQGLSEARRSVRALRSEALETDTLPDALRKALTQTQRDTGLTTHFYLEGEPVPLPDDIQLNLLRIAQEAITNTLRHARAAQLDLTLSFTSTQVQLRIVDDGMGFEPATLTEETGFGIIGIRERVAYFCGTFDLQSTPRVGTTIEVLIPL